MVEKILDWSDEKNTWVLKDVVAYSIYFLWDDDKIIYVGCTTNLVNRIRNHKTIRKFTHYSIYRKSYDKFDASNIESQTIAFLSHYSNHPLQNTRKHDYYPPKKIKL